ncbi:MAG: FAD/NAD(P)-binding protein [Paracoccus sp.]|nr:FAD/NAD(P)-binding protein [Paracoccus sp. (in: a-proteobacteria)]
MTDQPTIIPRTSRQGPASGPHVVIIGGGASGVLMATHLLSRQDRLFRVTIIEGRHTPGLGLAYSTLDPDHLLNTRVHNMSAFPQDPDHFRHWLQARPSQASVTDQCFVSRRIYGGYLAYLMTPWLTGAEPSRLRIVRDAALRLQDSPRGVVVQVSGGHSIIGDIAILATGHVLERPDPDGLLLNAWEDPGPIDPQGRVVIIGSGLSMVDRVISLLKSGHKGEILAVSRRGVLPRTHQPTKPLPIGLGDIPFGAPMSALAGWLRGLGRQAERQGGTWRDAVDGVRPHVKAIWRSLPTPERARFLRHAATWWDVHRHRIPPASGAIIERALMDGQLRLMRGAFTGASRNSDGSAVAHIRSLGSTESAELISAAIFDCRGIRRDPARHASPLIAGLLASGAARVDPLNIGLDVDLSCRLIGQSGAASERLFAIGPVSRAAFWEMTAIPDIREQTFKLAALLAVG